MKKVAVIAFVLGALAGGLTSQSARAAGDDLHGVVRALERIADAVSEIRRDGLKCR